MQTCVLTITKHPRKLETRYTWDWDLEPKLTADQDQALSDICFSPSWAIEHEISFWEALGHKVHVVRVTGG